MSNHPTILPLPPNLPPLDLDRYLNNYLLLQSFQRNYTLGSLIHIPVLRPALGSIAAGENYFEWRTTGISHPVLILTFIAIPYIFTPKPYFYSYDHADIHCTCINIHYHSIPEFLSTTLVDYINFIAWLRNFDALILISHLAHFLEELHRPVSPFIHPYSTVTSPISSFTNGSPHCLKFPL